MSELFVPGNILFIEDYDFGEGFSTKDKIMIILASDNKTLTVIQSLTTSRDRTGKSKLNHGCYNKDSDNPHFYFFDKNVSVGKNEKQSDFKFGLDTYVYFIQNVNKISTLSLLSKYRLGIKFIASLNDYQFKSLLECICNSKFVEKKVKNDLINIFNKLEKKE